MVRATPAAFRNRGFTLIELLTVISIIGVLTALPLPAVQSAREAARRTNCANHFKQLGLALSQYLDTVGALPIGRSGLFDIYKLHCMNRRTWAISILPYMEQVNAFGAFNYSLSFYQPENSTVVLARLDVFSCPSDRPGVQEPGSTVPRSKGNAAACWGSTHYFQGEPSRGADGPAPFTGPNGTAYYSGSAFGGNWAAGASRFSDGLSNTVWLGEVIVGQNRVADQQPYGAYDHRGDLYNDDRNASMFMTYTPPNSRTPDQLGDPVYCGNRYANNPPRNDKSPCFNAARSRHPGGGHTLFGDGGVRFVKDSVTTGVWRALGSPAGGEIVSADQF